MSRTEASAGEESDKSSQEWVAVSTVRIGLGILGFVLLLFALGQAIGFNLLEMLTAAITSHLGRWLIIAIFALGLIILAVRGFNDWLE